MLLPSYRPCIVTLTCPECVPFRALPLLSACQILVLSHFHHQSNSPSSGCCIFRVCNCEKHFVPSADDPLPKRAICKHAISEILCRSVSRFGPSRCSIPLEHLWRGRSKRLMITSLSRTFRCLWPKIIPQKALKFETSVS